MIRSPEVLKVLQTAPLFQGVSIKLLVEKLGESRLRTLERGEALLVPGQANNVIYLIVAGRLVVQARESGVEPIAMLGEGECVGEESFIGDVHATAYVIAATECKLLAFEHAPLWELIDSSHQAAHNMLSVLGMRIRPASQIAAESHEEQHGFSGAEIVDELTGLYNRGWIEEKIGRYLHRLDFDKRPNCLMMVEVDDFKALNEKYGQLGSEQVLRDTVRAMLSCLRPDDQAAHFNGEQFAVFMPYTGISDGCIGAERLRATINQSVIVLPSGDALPPISVSLGVSVAISGDTPDSLFASAFEALREAVASGGNCVKWQDRQTSGAPPAPPPADETPQIKPFMSLWQGAQPGETPG